MNLFDIINKRHIFTGRLNEDGPKLKKLVEAGYGNLRVYDDLIPDLEKKLHDAMVRKAG